MELSFRWFGSKDPITLQNIRQIPGMVGVVTSLYDEPVGKLWPRERLEAIKSEIEAASMRLNVIESLPVHEDIKLGRPSRDQLINVYRQNIQLLGECGVKVIYYNFMPLFDWLRTDLAYDLPDGSNVMKYDHNDLDPDANPWEADLPAYFPLDDTPDNLKEAYIGTTEEDLWNNLQYFLEAVVETAAEANIKMAIHPDDPPWNVFGLPRILKDEATLEKLLSMVDHPANGITFCTGSLGVNLANNLPHMIRQFGERIYFAHCRNVKLNGEKQFYEAAHPAEFGDVDMTAVMQAYHDIGFCGPMRPDHGRMIWGETGIPGYGLYDRALGAMYLRGLWDGLSLAG